MPMQGDQPRCIYCGRVLVVPTRPAHVFPNGAGGRLTTTTTVCNECNNSTSGIEGDFCLGLAQAGALVGARRGDRKPIPLGRLELWLRRAKTIARPSSRTPRTTAAKARPLRRSRHRRPEARHANDNDHQSACLDDHHQARSATSEVEPVVRELGASKWSPRSPSPRSRRLRFCRQPAIASR
jgi:hypothetical protein